MSYTLRVATEVIALSQGNNRYSCKSELMIFCESGALKRKFEGGKEMF